jgi:hypothetical protein
MRSIVAILLLAILSGCSQFYSPPVSLPVEDKEYIDPSADLEVTQSQPISRGTRNTDDQLMALPKVVTGNTHIGRVSSGDENQNHSTITSHAYTTVHSVDELKQLRDTLTYVIIPYDLSTQELGRDSKKYKRYKKVLELIQEHQRVENNISKDDSSQKEKNKFVILSKNSDGKKVDIESYNYKLANMVLDFFRKSHSTNIFNNEGPFLITTTKNILFDKNKKFEFLYLNMSNFNDSAINQVLESYKARLVSDSMDEVGLLERLHYSLLSFATNFNADMYIIQSAMAGEL